MTPNDPIKRMSPEIRKSAAFIVVPKPKEHDYPEANERDRSDRSTDPAQVI